MIVTYREIAGIIHMSIEYNGVSVGNLHCPAAAFDQIKSCFATGVQFVERLGSVPG